VTSLVLFDLNGTLLDPAALAEPLGGDEQAREIVRSALELAVVQGMVLSLTGRFAPFSELLGSALRQRLTRAGKSSDRVPEAVAAASAMAPTPGARRCLETLAGAGVRIAVVSNSSTETAEAALDHARLRRFCELVRGSDQVQTYKPDRRVYLSALAQLDVTPAETWLVAAHWWDLAGARAAGLQTAWTAHKEKVLLDRAEVDLTAPDLERLGQALARARDAS
jgi:2-haloacid dehalogenase